jgi:hypothetical protein
VTVRLPNGSERTFITSARPQIGSSVVAFANGERAVRFEPEGSFFRTAVVEQNQLTFRVSNGVTRTFTIAEVSRPVADRVVFFTRPMFVGSPTVFLQTASFDENEVMFVQPDGVLVPMGITGMQLLPGGQVAFFTTDLVGPTYVPPTLSFIGQVVGLAGNLVTFVTPDGQTFTLLDNGPLPAMGTEEVVYENGDAVVGFAPAVTTFQGQVVAVNGEETTFLMPDGTLRTLVLAQPAPVVGTRVVVFENGVQVQRIVTL